MPTEFHWQYALRVHPICSVTIVIDFQGVHAPTNHVKTEAHACRQADHRTAIVGQVFRVQRAPLEAVRVTSVSSTHNWTTL